MDEFTRQILGCLSWGAMGVFLSLACHNLLVLIASEAIKEQAKRGELSTDVVASAMYLVLLCAPIAAGASLAAASFAPLWMRAASGFATCTIALIAGIPSVREAMGIIQPN